MFTMTFTTKHGVRSKVDFEHENEAAAHMRIKLIDWAQGVCITETKITNESTLTSAVCEGALSDLEAKFEMNVICDMSMHDRLVLKRRLDGLMTLVEVAHTSPRD